MIYVLDSSALLRLLDGEPGCEQVMQALEQQASTGARLRMSAVQWSEVAKVYYKRHGKTGISQLRQATEDLNLEIVPVDTQRAERCAWFVATYALHNADGFAVDLTLDYPESTLLTADYDFKHVEHIIFVSFLPVKKPKPTP